MRDSTAQWLLNYINESDDYQFKNYKEFWSHFDTQFVDQDLDGTAMTKVFNVKQGNRDTQSYLSELYPLLVKSKVGFKAAKEILIRGLSPENQKVLFYTTIEDDDDEDDEDDNEDNNANILNYRQRVGKVLRKAETSFQKKSLLHAIVQTRSALVARMAPVAPRHHVREWHPTNSNLGFYGSAPMNLENSRGVLQQERERRYLIGACFYCGGQKHLAQDCPQQAPSLPLQYHVHDTGTGKRRRPSVNEGTRKVRRPYGSLPQARGLVFTNLFASLFEIHESCQEFSSLQQNAPEVISNAISDCGELMFLPCVIKQKNEKILTQVMLDSGATHSYINQSFAKQIGLTFQEKPRPEKVIIADGRPIKGGPIKNSVTITIIERPERTGSQKNYHARRDEPHRRYNHSWNGLAAPSQPLYQLPKRSNLVQKFLLSKYLSPRTSSNSTNHGPGNTTATARSQDPRRKIRRQRGGTQETDPAGISRIPGCLQEVRS